MIASGAARAIDSAERTQAKKKKPSAIVEGNIIITPAIRFGTRSASVTRRIIKAPPTKNEVTS